MSRSSRRSFEGDSKDDVPELLSIERAVGAQNGPAEGTNDVPPCRLSRFDHLPCQLIGIQNSGSALFEQGCHRTLACSHPSR